MPVQTKRAQVHRIELLGIRALLCRVSIGVLFASALSLVSRAQVGEHLKFDIQAVDKDADPCVDFYQYACGGWLKKNPIAADRAYSAVFQQMREVNQRRVFELLQRFASAPRSPGERKIGGYYATCMDEKAIEAMDLRPLQSELERIDGMKNGNDLAMEAARLHGFGADALFSMGADQKLEDATQVIAYLDQSGLNLPEPDYYLSDDAEVARTRAEYRVHLQGEFSLLGENPVQAASAADDVIKIETALARNELTPVERRDRKAWYHLMRLAELKNLRPNFAGSNIFRRPDSYLPGKST